MHVPLKSSVCTRSRQQNSRLPTAGVTDATEKRSQVHFFTDRRALRSEGAEWIQAAGYLFRLRLNLFFFRIAGAPGFPRCQLMRLHGPPSMGEARPFPNG